MSYVQVLGLDLGGHVLGLGLGGQILGLDGQVLGLAYCGPDSKSAITLTPYPNHRTIDRLHIK